ncbi:fumarylacetoacetate hydrolase family protein [Bradyrhizobium sp. 14AA]
MKLLTFIQDDVNKLGVVHGDRIVDIAGLAKASGSKAYRSMLDLIEAGKPGLDDVANQLKSADAKKLAQFSFGFDNVKLAAPIPRPRKNVFCVGLNYHSHVDEASRVLDTAKEAPPWPVYFTKTPLSIVPPDGNILHHADVTKQLDWEAELAVIIGTTCKRVSEKDALSYVFGYSCMIDISARDCRRAGQWFWAKGHDGTAPFGPVIVTADEIQDPHALDIELQVNGVTKQFSNTSRMIFKIPALIADLTTAVTLEAGDIIATGTPGGVGISFSPPEFLKAGDVVEMRIQGIGSLKGTVANA